MITETQILKAQLLAVLTLSTKEVSQIIFLIVTKDCVADPYCLYEMMY